MDVSDIDSAIDKATVHGVVTELSPRQSFARKNSTSKYFSGSVSDDKQDIRLVSLSPKLRSECMLTTHAASSWQDTFTWVQ